MRRMLGLLLLASWASAAPDWSGEVIYQVMPDRFFDGDKSNDQGVDLSDPRAWHGGDLRGLTQKLPYIRGLGATAVWLTPVYQQVPGVRDGATGYHGYWPEDFRNVDPHFGTLEDFDAFVKAAHDAGLKVMLDQVVNHFGYGAAAVTEQPGWFHDAATCAAKGNNDVYCPIFGLPDLAQERPEVREFLLGNDDFWRQQGVDAFRYDAIKHVPRDFLTTLLKRDSQAGTFTLGEYYGADADIITGYQKLGFSSLFDFSLQSALQGSVMGGASLEGVRGVLERQEDLRDPGNVALFLDNHDLPRFANGSLFEDVGRERTVYGVRALMTLRGVPVLWQGTEIAMRGGGDPDNRRDMRFSEAWTPQERGVYEAVKGAVGVRRASAALSRGDLKLLPSPQGLQGDLLLFTRKAGGERVLVAWHGGKERRTVAVRSSLLTSLGLHGDLFGQDAKLSAKGGVLYLSLPPHSATAFELN